MKIRSALSQKGGQTFSPLLKVDKLFNNPIKTDDARIWNLKQVHKCNHSEDGECYNKKTGELQRDMRKETPSKIRKWYGY